MANWELPVVLFVALTVLAVGGGFVFALRQSDDEPTKDDSSD